MCVCQYQKYKPRLRLCLMFIHNRTIILTSYSRMHSKGSRFTLGVRLSRLCSPDFAQPFATVRVRPIQYGRASGGFCKSGQFWRFQKSRSLVSRGRRGTSWQSNMFHNVLNIVLCGTRNTFALFQADELHFSWQVQHFGDLHRHFAWQAQHFRCVALRVFLRITLSGLREVVTTCKFRGRCVEIDRILPWNIDFEVANFQVHEKVDFKDTKCEKLRKSRTKCLSEPPTCLVSILWFSCGSAVSGDRL